MNTAIKIEHLSKQYMLGLTHARSIRDCVNNLAARVAGRKSSPAQISAADPERVGEDGSFWALDDVSFNVEQGEVIGIIGKNGAGKSTLLKILSRITSPTSGRVEMKGRVASLLEVGTGFHPELTGRENVYLNGTILGMTKSEVDRQFDAIVDFAGVEKFINTPVKRYSSGMKVRLGFAVAAHLESEILVVDEVLAVGDIAFQRKCLSKMRDVATEGRTVLFVSHNLAAVQNLCHSGVVLSKGRMVFQGRSDEAISDYTRRHAPEKSRKILPPPASKVPAEATRATLHSIDGEEVDQVVFGQPWGVKVEFVVTEPIAELKVGIGFRTATEVGVFTSYAETQDYQPGRYVAEFWENDLTWCCGSYYIAVGLSAEGRSLHYVPEAFQLNIVPGASSTEHQSVKTHGILSHQLQSKVYPI